MRDRTIYKPFQVVTVEDLLRDSEFCQKYGAWITNIIGAGTFAVAGCVLRRPGGNDVAWDHNLGSLTLQAGWTFLLAPANAITGAGIVKLDGELSITDPKLVIPESRVGQTVYVLMRLSEPGPSGDFVPRVYVDPQTGARLVRSEQVYEAQSPVYAVTGDPYELQSLLGQGYQIAFILTMGQGGQKIIKPVFVFPEFEEGFGAGSVAQAITGLALRLFEARGQPLTQPLSCRSLAQVNSDLITVNNRLNGHDTDIAQIKTRLNNAEEVTGLDRIYIAKYDFTTSGNDWNMVTSFDRAFARYATINKQEGIINLRAGTYLARVYLDWYTTEEAYPDVAFFEGGNPTAIITFANNRRLFIKPHLWSVRNNVAVRFGVSPYKSSLIVVLQVELEQVALLP
jgi:hypothetical protein